MTNVLGLPNVSDQKIPVDIIGLGLVTAGGLHPSAVWSNLQTGALNLQDVPESFRTKTRQAHFISLDILTAALQAIDQALYFLPSGRAIDQICLGSTSASYRESESGGNTLRPSNLVQFMAHEYAIMKHVQFSQACSSSGAAIAFGADLIRLGLAEVVLAGGVDEVTESVMSAFEAVRIHSAVCQPFDVDRYSINLGSAAAFVLLAKPGILKPLARVQGIGSNADNYDSVMPHAPRIAKCISDAVLDAGAGAGVDFIIAHGTGTKASDQIEADAIYMALGPVRTASYKGALGHSQGASGAVSVVLAVKALESQRIFPTAGLVNGDPSITSKIILNTQSLPMALNNVLCLSFGTWGTNSALVIGRP